MPAERRHRSADLADYEVLDSSDTLIGPPGDDPLDRGIATPERWSAAMRFGSTEAEQSGATLDQRLTREDPDDSLDAGDERPDGVSWDENASDGDIESLAAADGAGPRTGRLIRAYDDNGAVFRTWETAAVARDAGIDGGGASAEEAALHVLPDEDTGL